MYLALLMIHLLICSLLWIRETKSNLKKQTAALAEHFNGFKAHLVIIQVGGRDDSNVYIRQKIKSAAEVGVEASHVQFPKTITQNEVCIIISLNYASIELVTKYLYLRIHYHNIIMCLFMLISYCQKSTNTTVIHPYMVLSFKCH